MTIFKILVILNIDKIYMNNQFVDYSLIERSIPTQMNEARRRYLAPEDAIPVIQENPSVIPIIVSPLASHRVIWMDVGKHTFRERKFRLSIAAVAARTDVRPFSTDIELLATDIFDVNTLPPAGFIFHMSRCGSTLLAKALARTPRHNVIIEGTPFSEGLWSYLTNNWKEPCRTGPSDMTIIRNLILLTSRARNPGQQVSFFKFMSWNSVFIKLIMNIFPETPSLFLYRNPVEVLMSNIKNGSPYLPIKGTDMAAYLTGRRPIETRSMSDVDFYLSLYEVYLLAALQYNSKKLSYINHIFLKKKTFGEILRLAFGNTANSEQIALMTEQFDFYSKDDSNSIRFESDSEARRNAATPEMTAEVERRLSDLYNQLESVDRNLAHKLNVLYSQSENR
jgi:hypothetical protein